MNHVIYGTINQSLPTFSGQKKDDNVSSLKLKDTGYESYNSVEGGIEKIVYKPKNKKYTTPILMQHGMYHGAWCWELWQKLFAEWGWESHAYSLPGQGKSPNRRPSYFSTLGYYENSLKEELKRFETPPIIFGHSMGAALIQRIIKIMDDFPAAVMVAPWSSHSNFKDGIAKLFRLDPIGLILSVLTCNPTFFIRSPERAKAMFLTENSICSQDMLFKNLNSDSGFVMYGHNPPFWHPPTDVKTPMLWMAGKLDAVLGEKSVKESAEFYGADYIAMEGTGHNIMIENNYKESAQIIHDWLMEQNIA